MSQSSNHHPATRGSFKSYVTGYLLSAALTLAAFLLVRQHVQSDHEQFSHEFLTIAVLILAISQLLVQLLFFLHLGRERKPRWNLAAFGFMLLVLLIVVLGSLWIMSNLNYRMLPTDQQINQYIQDQESGGI